ncbi:Hsp20/alpha crystallin family protein [Methylonatrum kenyense]|uniref:Hsp20/alpha crystallin family protein n=1 Tax=Methylonatrum kenyense TaxID=455253 RepID=UPI0020C10C95|nr:Hsp20/alpha crystallin family protein [Methylonatrum kenyense]MCK8515360.1 Hsp20/alpha crystallin family protein [Methylonatrum kenyense]
MTMFRDLWRANDPLFGDLGRLLRMMDSNWDNVGSADLRSAPRGSFPLLNVGETDEAYNVYVFAPGVEEQDIEISVQDNVLMLSGKRADPADDEKAAGRNWYRRERFSGEFNRAITLPDGVDADRVKASLKNGVLTISLHKRAEIQPRRIDIQAA